LNEEEEVKTFQADVRELVMVVMQSMERKEKES
jgi:hypothetical protein